jgi:hypothetical protein
MLVVVRKSSALRDGHVAIDSQLYKGRTRLSWTTPLFISRLGVSPGSRPILTEEPGLTPKWLIDRENRGRWKAVTIVSILSILSVDYHIDSGR